MDNRKWTLRMISLAFLFIASSYAELLIHQVTEGRGTLDNESYSLDANLGVTREFREARPSSKILTITNFSVIKDRHEMYESSVFEVSGYRWRLDLYLNGNPRDGGNGHISLYVRLIRPSPGTEFDADLKLFVYNGKQRKYLTITDGAVRRFTTYITIYGYSRLIPLSTFHNTSEGYIDQDTASFGAEISIVNPAQVQEKVTFLSYPPNNVFTWTVHNFSNLEDRSYETAFFLVGDRHWTMPFYPKGRQGSKNALAVYLRAGGFRRMALATRTYAQFFLRLKNQRSSNHIQLYYSYWYPSSPIFSIGTDRMILFEDLKDASKGYLVNDTIILEAEIVMISVTNIVSV